MVMALGVIAEAKTRARAEGIDIGQEHGIEIGREEGREEGKKQARERMIQSMRDKGLSEADIQEIIELRNANGKKKS